MMDDPLQAGRITLNPKEAIMYRSNKFPASPAARPGELSHAEIPQGKELRDGGSEQRQESSLSADDIDEQIRVFFAKGLA